MCLCKQNIPTGVIKVLSHKMDESTKNIFKKELEYLINFETEQANHLNNFKLAIHNQFSDSIEEEYALKKFGGDLKNVTQLAQIIFEAFDSINFNSIDLIRQVRSFDSVIQMLQFHFTAINLENRDITSIHSHLSNTFLILNNINEIVDLTFSNSRIFLKFLTNFFRI